jgi:hypothetical protein
MKYCAKPILKTPKNNFAWQGEARKIQDEG